MKTLTFLNFLSPWIARNRVSTTIVLIAAAGIAFMYQHDLREPSPDELKLQSVYVTHVGKLERTASGGISQRFAVRTNAGYGIGFSNESRNELVKRYQPTVFVPFSPAVDITEADLGKIVPNNTYLLTLLRHEIIEISGNGVPLISIKRSTDSVERSKQQWRVVAIALLISGAAFFWGATLLQRSAPKVETEEGPVNAPSA